jgi:hypothetical protein
MAKNNEYHQESPGSESERDLLKAKAIKCRISNWGCIYHACMTDDCQKQEVLKHDRSWGPGKCQNMKDEKNR